ncbi:hypothetical protein BKA70DRAFT_1405033 [Coprinopsis sp. MPI-PUGE-AT-0042]|nr:hypothetical protein BKA70DRAFT_1405033 [Coprinopsis sp. MPI-PUGE-AT-0042]
MLTWSFPLINGFNSCSCNLNPRDCPRTSDVTRRATLGSPRAICLPLVSAWRRGGLRPTTAYFATQEEAAFDLVDGDPPRRGGGSGGPDFDKVIQDWPFCRTIDGPWIRHLHEARSTSSNPRKMKRVSPNAAEPWAGHRIGRQAGYDIQLTELSKVSSIRNG